MSVEPRRWTLPGAALLVVLAAGSAWPAEADKSAGGIWIYNANMSISIVNLTDHTLRWDPSKVSCVSKSGFQCSLFPDAQHVSIPPYRTIRNEFTSGGWEKPTRWSGTMTFTVDTLTQYPFVLVFTEQGAAGGATGDGTWIGLDKGPNSTGWCTTPATSDADGWCRSRWTTPLGDKHLHNTMSLIGPSFMVSLFSPDNVNIVVVVHQHATSLGDESSKYKGFMLDWVYNPGSSVP